MAKKANTLNDLASFLKSDSIGGVREFTTEVEKDFFTKKPLTLVDVKTETNNDTKTIQEERVISTGNGRLTLEELNNSIKKFATENNTTVDKVISKLNLTTQTTQTTQTNSTELNPFVSFFTWTTNLQMSYFQYLLDLQKSFFGK
jgi:hypothetical protein